MYDQTDRQGMVQILTDFNNPPKPLSNK